MLTIHQYNRGLQPYSPGLEFVMGIDCLPQERNVDGQANLCFYIPRIINYLQLEYVIIGWCRLSYN